MLEQDILVITLSSAMRTDVTWKHLNKVLNSSHGIKQMKKLYHNGIELTDADISIAKKNSTSCEPDDLQISPIIYVIDLISPVLTHIFNLCLQHGVFPEKMQIAKVSVLYKKGDRNDIGNYRPISILSVFSKGLEKILHSRLVKFSDKHNIITSSQFGFRKSRSTELALLEQKDYILRSFEDKKMTPGIFIDFRKAFDHLNHNLLIRKLESYGFRGYA